MRGSGGREASTPGVLGVTPACRRQGRTNSSSAVFPKVAFLGDSFIVADISINWASLLNSASKVCRKGLRDIGRLPVLEGVGSAGEGMAGDAALLRKGLLEDRLSVRPGDGRRSADKGGYQWIFVFVTANVGETGDKGAYQALTAQRS